MAQGKSFFDDVKKELECSVCQELFSDVNEPKILKCLHTFCKNCLEAWLRQQCQGQLSCPTCRQITECPNNNISSLPSNFFYKQMVEIVEAYSGVVKAADSPHCANCEEEKQLKFYCFDCNTFLCEECTGAHKKWKLFRDHHVKEIGKFESSDVQDYARKANVCKKHKDELRFYCEKCKLCICRDCAILEHRDDKIISMEQGLENKKSEIKSKMQDVEAIACRLRNQRKTLEKRSEKVLGSINQATSEVHRVAEHRISLIRQHETAMTKALLEQKQSFQGAFSDQISSMDEKLMEIDSSLTFGNEVLDRENLPEILNIEEILDQRFQELSLEFCVNLNYSCFRYIPNEASSLNDEPGELIFTKSDPMLSTANGKGLTEGVEGEDCSFKIETKDSKGQRSYSGFDKVDVDIRSVEGRNIITPEIIDCKNGSYEVKYKPVVAGKYQVSITVEGDAILNSPFQLEVKEKLSHCRDKGSLFGRQKSRLARVPICGLCKYNSFEKLLSCGHLLCNTCNKGMQSLGLYCALCWMKEGEILYQGHQPEGHMSWRTDPGNSLPGYEGHGTLIISCNFDRGIQGRFHPNPGVPYCCFFCTFYLPDNREGRGLCLLLRKAFDNGWMFQIADNSIVYNGLELKTSPHGGPAKCGYPDADYLDRLTRQLYKKGFFL